MPVCLCFARFPRKNYFTRHSSDGDSSMTTAAEVTETEARMDLVVRTLYKTLIINNVSGNWEVAELKRQLHLRGMEEQIPVPIASRQRLVYKGNVLSSGSLEEAGIGPGDHLVLLVQRSNASVPVRPVDTAPVPNSASICSAIIAEARRRGLENTIVEEHTRNVRTYGMPMEAMALEVDNQLLQLIQALGGRTGALGARGGQQRHAGGEEGVAAAAQPQQQQGGPVAPAGARRYMGPAPVPVAMPANAFPGMFFYGMPPPPAAGPPVPPPQPPAPPPPPAIPEPNAQAAVQLGEMGFGDAVVRKALLLHRNDMESALNWLLQHGEDPAAADPLTEEQLRQIYSRGPRGPPSEPELVEQLVAMGFGRSQSAAALRRFRTMDMALAYLLRTAEQAGPADQPGQQQQQEGAGAAPAAAPEQTAAEQQQQEGGAQEGGSAERQAVERGREVGPGAGLFGEGGAEDAGRRQEGGDEMDVDVETGGAAGAPGGRRLSAGEGDVLGVPGMASDDPFDALMEGYGLGSGAGGQQLAGGEAPGAAHQLGGQSGAGGGAETEDDDDDDEDGDNEEDEDEEDEEFTGHAGMPTMIEQLAMGQGPGGGRAAVVHLPLGTLAGGLMQEEALGGFGAPFALYGDGAAGVGATPAIGVTRGPDGNELVLGSGGAVMPPLMPPRGVMMRAHGGRGLLGLDVGGGGGVGGGLGLGGGLEGGAALVDLPGLFRGGGGDEELVQQLLNAVLRDALQGSEGGAPGAGARQ